MTTTANVANTSSTSSSTSAAGTSKTAAAATEDRFLKLLVAQMQNQDPLNPMDNAQVTSQMAQINTVDGITKLNAAVQGLATQFGQLQALQGAGLVGRDVAVAGDRLAIGEDGVGRGAFDLASAAGQVRLELLSSRGTVLATQELGAASAGRNHFEWPATGHDDTDGLRFRIVAANGGTGVAATSLALDRVDSVSANGGTLTLQLQHLGPVAYSAVKSVH
jgi:flagellar basal-body rod modification protein FlgD